MRFQDNRSETEGGGLACIDGASPSVTYCEFISNEAGDHGGGVYVDGYSTHPVITESQFLQNESNTGNGGAMYIRDSFTMVSFCSFVENTALHAGGAVYLRNNQSIISPGNTFTDNRGCGGADLAARSASNPTVNATSNSFSGSAVTDFYVMPQNVFDTSGHMSSLTPMSVNLYVAPDGDDDLNDGLSPASPFQTIRHALSRIQTGAPSLNLTVILAAGEYSETATGEIFPLPSLDGVIVQGAGEGVTIINSESVPGTFRSLFGNLDRISDVTLTGIVGPGLYCRDSMGLYTDVTFQDYANTSYGAGTYIDDADAVFMNCTFTGCQASVAGGAVYLKTPLTTFVAVTFSGNTAVYSGGAVHNNTGNSVFDGCTFTGNVSPAGGAIRIENGAPVIAGDTAGPNVFSDNFSPRGANLSAQSIPAAPYNVQDNSYDVTPESAWCAAPVEAFDATGFVVTGPAPMPGAEVYVAEDGDNANDGLTPNTAFRNVSYAMKRVVGTDSQQAIVNVGPGVYDAIAGEQFPVPLLPHTSVIGTGYPVTALTADTGTVVVAYYSDDSSLEDVTVSSGTGPCITVEESLSEFLQMNVDGCDAPFNGGGMLITGGAPVVDDCIFQNNHSSRQGGAIHASTNTQPIISNCSFVSNSADQLGGGVLIGFNATADVSNCLFDLNSAQQDGGGLAAFFGAVNINTCSFTGNSAGDTGGGLYLSSDASTLSNNGNIFAGNRASLGADIAAGELFDTPVSLGQSQFDGIPESPFYVAPQGSFDVSGTSGELEPIRQDIYVAPWGSNENSGVSPDEPFETIRYGLSRILPDPEPVILTVHLESGDYILANDPFPVPLPLLDRVTVAGSHVLGTTIDADGSDGAFRGFWTDDSMLSDMTIQNSDGSAVAVEFSDLSIERCNFEANAEQGSGAALNAAGGVTFMDDCLFASNSAGANGGAVSIRQYGMLFLSRSLFDTNTAGSNGGAISTWIGQGRVHDCVFTGNSGAQGGAWASRNTDAVQISGSRFLYNSADLGGGLWAQQGSFSLIDCLIAENLVAVGSSGNAHGGGLYIDGCDVILTNCTVAGNTVTGFSRISGGGICTAGNADVTILDSILRSNTALAGFDLQVGFPWSPSDVAVSFSNLDVNNPGAVEYAPGSTLTLGAGIQGADPLFVHDDLPWQLSSTWSGQPVDSPCIDAGSEPAAERTYLTPLQIEFMGRRTTESGGFPDQEWVDLGWHADPGPCVHDGDMNDDGELTMSDVQIIFGLALLPRPVNYYDICTGDLNWDAILTAQDAQTAMLMILSIPSSRRFPCPRCPVSRTFPA